MILVVIRSNCRYSSSEVVDMGPSVTPLIWFSVGEGGNVQQRVSEENASVVRSGFCGMTPLSLVL
jgi:hypothetical protein